MTEIIFITTARCLIRRFEEKDLPAFAAYRNNAAWMKHQLFKGLTLPEYREALLTSRSAEEGVQLAIVHADSGHLIGDLYVHAQNGDYWVGYTVAPAYARRRYALEAVRALLGWLKQKKACTRVLAAVLPENTPSEKLLIQLGFAFLRFDPNTRENIYAADLNAISL